MKRIKIIVINENKLALQRPGSPGIEILHTSVLRGAIGTTIPEPSMIFYNDKVRLATPQDFEDYGVYFGSFNNPKEYLFHTH
jgi:hypothetical protein